MSSKKQLLIKDPREELVAQGNDLIRHVRFPLTALEQNVIYFVMSKVKPADKDFMKQSFTVTEFCEMCGIKPDNQGGANYRTIKAAVKSVADKSAWVEYPNGRESLIRWFDTYDIDRNSGIITATLSQSIKPYLIGLIERAKAGGEGYTQTHLYNYIAMQSKYSKRLYEILKSYLYSRGGTEKLYRLTFQEYDLDELKQLLNAYNYTRWQDFRRKALEPATEEINKITDIAITYSIVRTGRKITGVSFSFKHKKDIERWGAEEQAKKIIDSPKRTPKRLDNAPLSTKNETHMQEQLDMPNTPLVDDGVECTECGTLNIGYMDDYFLCINCGVGNHKHIINEKNDDLQVETPNNWQNCTSHDCLIRFAKKKGYKIGWAFKKAEELNLPVISDMSKQQKIYDETVTQVH